jgi:multiple sugar transport system permease protein
VKAGSILLYLLAFGLALFYLYPVINMVFEGFDVDLSSFYAPGFRLIGGVPYYSGGITPSLTYWIDMLRTQGFLKLIFNSVVIGTLSTTAAVFLALFTAYPMTFVYRVRYSRIDLLMLAMRATPVFVYIVPFLILLPQLGLWDTQLGMVLVYMSFNTPLTYLLVRSLLRDFPRELVEAAEIMGAPTTMIIRRVLLPFSIHALVVIWVFAFVLSWNEFLLASFLTGPDSRTVSVGVWSGVGEQIGTFRTIEFEAQAASGTIAMIVPLAIILFLRRKLARLFSYQLSERR